MAILKKIKKEEIKETENTEKKEAKKTVKKKVSKKKEVSEKEVLSFGLIPRVTEKASSLNGKGVYVFTVEANFNKIMVKQAMKKQYNVEPKKVRIINIPGKMVYIKRRPAKKDGYKKAIVYLKAGDKIAIS